VRRQGAQVVSSIQALNERIAQGEIVLLDGATGTEVERRGVPMDGAAWSAAAVATHPDTIRQVHEDHIRAGASIVTSNSFSTAGISSSRRSHRCSRRAARW
jgi:S-methylmethionine-dependent homocysteine/selenocysteine methylase